MKNIIKLLLNRVSRLVYYIYLVLHYATPDEIRYKKPRISKLELKLENVLVEETYNYFKKHFEKSIIFINWTRIREYAIQNSLLNDKHKEYY